MACFAHDHQLASRPAICEIDRSRWPRDQVKSPLNDITRNAVQALGFSQQLVLLNKTIVGVVMGADPTSCERSRCLCQVPDQPRIRTQVGTLSFPSSKSFGRIHSLEFVI